MSDLKVGQKYIFSTGSGWEPVVELLEINESRAGIYDGYKYKIQLTDAGSSVPIPFYAKARELLPYENAEESVKPKPVKYLMGKASAYAGEIVLITDPHRDMGPVEAVRESDGTTFTTFWEWVEPYGPLAVDRLREIAEAANQMAHLTFSFSELLGILDKIQENASMVADAINRDNRELRTEPSDET